MPIQHKMPPTHTPTVYKSTHVRTWRASAYTVLHSALERGKQESDILLHHVSRMQHRSGKIYCDRDSAKMRWHYPSKLWLRSQSNLQHHWWRFVFNWGCFRSNHGRESNKYGMWGLVRGRFWLNQAPVIEWDAYETCIFQKIQGPLPHSLYR